ncbi:3-methyl-2-oxobutanoate hydroxymethyltransferase [Aestuariispira insulae]|uniref:3-methyl-2-oxobutanoate hydroxymethyltransferase n=1 Tax=Aestuariispira insulae TaxID=1461337 RepID=A0A3D9HTZ5_9PROT|nr:3-methyl-2-oxobutanoate hydroxymethyltransferase [Aestuariispira insulae]RED52346.1 ketopantoate hydroxymethyltransferase [Aestuariispira insulae]
MSATKKQSIRRLTAPDIAARKGQTPIVSLTAYTAPMAKILDEHVDVLLVGDSLGMVIYGMDNTLAVTLEMMIHHAAAVMRGSKHAMVVVDMPFGTYEESKEAAFRNAARLMAESGCAAVKIEGGREMAETVAFLVERGIPVMGHVGLMPQQVQNMGGFKAQGRNDEQALAIIEDAKTIADAGAFSVVVEGVMEQVARAVTEAISVPTIGIGASPACDGQVLVTDDVLGLYSEFTPKFVKRYAELGEAVDQAVEQYAADVKARQFPGAEHCFGLKAAE